MASTGSGKPICSQSHLSEVSPLSVALKTVTVLVWLMMALSRPSNKIFRCFWIFHACLLQAISGVMMFLALCQQVVSEAPEHFRPSEMHLSTSWKLLCLPPYLFTHFPWLQPIPLCKILLLQLLNLCGFNFYRTWHLTVRSRWIALTHPLWFQSLSAHWRCGCWMNTHPLWFHTADRLVVVCHYFSASLRPHTPTADGLVWTQE